MDERKTFIDDLTRFASEAGSTIRRAGGSALDKFETWRLEQDVQTLYTRLGRLTFLRLQGGDSHENESADQSKLTPDLNLDQEAADIIGKITQLREEIAIRKDTVNVSKEF